MAFERRPLAHFGTGLRKNFLNELLRSLMAVLFATYWLFLSPTECSYRSLIVLAAYLVLLFHAPVVNYWVFFRPLDVRVAH